MNDYELWEHLSQYGQLSARWWYDIAVLPISMLAGFTFLLMWFALRRQPQLPMLFFWLGRVGDLSYKGDNLSCKR